MKIFPDFELKEAKIKEVFCNGKFAVTHTHDFRALTTVRLKHTDGKWYLCDHMQMARCADFLADKARIEIIRNLMTQAYASMKLMKVNPDFILRHTNKNDEPMFKLDEYQGEEEDRMLEIVNPTIYGRGN